MRRDALAENSALSAAKAARRLKPDPEQHPLISGKPTKPGAPSARLDAPSSTQRPCPWIRIVAEVDSANPPGPRICKLCL